MKFSRIASLMLVASIAIGFILGTTVLSETLFGKTPANPTTFSAELEFLKEVNRTGVPEDSRLIFVLMQQFSALNRFDAGIAYFESFVDSHDTALSESERALYLVAISQLRAMKAGEVPLWKRIGWVNDTIDLLEEARDLSNGETFIVRLLTGIVYAQLPSSPFGKTEQAILDLKWALANLHQAPGPGYDREIYFHLALAHEKLGGQQEASDLLTKSGYEYLDKDIVLLTNFSVEAERGAAMWTERVWEVVPGRIYAISGFEFAEYFFVISEDGKELIAIDAGTRVDSAREAYTALNQRVSNLPPLTTVLVTHAHWDHIGGHRFFRELNPDVQFHARDNYVEVHAPVSELAIPFTYFFGSRFDLAAVTDFVPEVTHATKSRVEIGGTTIDLIPVDGGETGDHLFFHFPQYETLFVGDFIMPYFGAPFFEEGDIQGFYDAVDTIAALEPRYILHGHAPLTDIYAKSETLEAMRDALQWLEGEVLGALGRSTSRAEIHHLNLIPEVVRSNSMLALPFLVLRENFINRVYDKNMGYWHVDLQGMDTLSSGELASVLTRYAGLTEPDLTQMLATMNRNGDFELASKLTVWLDDDGFQSEAYRAERATTFRRLKQKYQSFNPFKFIIYSELANHDTPQLETVPAYIDRVAVSSGG